MSKKIAHVACGLFAALATNKALAAWEVVPDVTFAVGVDDNPRLNDPELLDTGTAQSAWVDARVGLTNTTERGSVFFEPRLRTDSYADSDDADLESDDLFLTARAERRSARGGRLGLQSYISRESILSSELLDAAPLDPDAPDPPPVDTGVLARPDEYRSRILLSPYVEAPMSERTSLLFDARYQDVSYSGPPTSGRSDFEDTGLGIGIARNVNDRNRATARLIVSSFEADRTNNQTDTVGVEGTFQRTLSSIWTFELTTGLQRSEIEFVRDELPASDVDTSATLGLGFRKRTEIARLNLDLQRLVTPNASGFLEQRDQFRVSLSRRLRERLTADVAVRLIDSKALGDVQTFDREYARLSFGVQWALRPQWALDVGFDTIKQDFSDAERDGTSNSVRIGMTYRGLSRSRTF